MVRSLFKVFNREARGMHEAAYVLAAFALGSQFLALVRDRLLAASFGASHTLDLYYAAFRIPDFLFATLASLLSLYALLPVLSRLEQVHTGPMVSFLRKALLIFFVVMSAVSALVWVYVPQLVLVLSPKIASPELVFLARILLLQPIFLGASNILASLTQLRHRFFLYSISPLLYNIGIIFGVLALYPRFGVAGLGWGVVLGAFLHLCVQVPFFAREHAEPPLSWKLAYKECAAVLALSVPRTLALAAGQISLFALVGIASFFSAGSISVFMFAFNLQAVPLTIIGVSYSVAAFPSLARLHAAGKRQEFAEYVETALRHIFFWTIPATVFVIVMRAQLVRVVLGAGAFSWEATRLTAAALALFVLALAAQSVTLLIARAYYAAGNTRKPLYWGVVDVVVSVLSSLLFVAAFNHSSSLRAFVEALLRVADVPGTVVLMLALGYALGSVAQFGAGFYFFMRDFEVPRARLGRLVFQSFAASVIGGAAAYLILTISGMAETINTLLGLVLQGTIAGAVELSVTALVLMLLKNEELHEALAAANRKFRPTAVPALEATEVSS
ncbi:MAG: lipid II flippase MurJ [bacterium]